MKKILLLFVGTLLLCSCLYDRVTHMDEEDLKLLDVFEKDVFCFVSDSNEVDYLVVDSTQIRNSTSPWQKDESTNEYIASGLLFYRIIHKGEIIYGSLYIEKKLEDSPVFFELTLDDLFTGYEPLDPTTVPQDTTINDVKYNDCYVIDDRYERSERMVDKVGLVYSFVWSKSKGLLQYKLKTGEVYTRK